VLRTKQETFEVAGGEERELVVFLSLWMRMILEDLQQQKHVYYDQGQLKRKGSYCWSEERRWQRSGNAISSMPTVLDFGSLEILHR